LSAAVDHLGGSVNDVVLAACTSGLRCLLLGRGEEPPRQGLRAMVPINVRDASEHLALGNRIRVAMPYTSRMSAPSTRSTDLSNPRNAFQCGRVLTA
jgi:diacylglycerol O-acyltransferase / wax synthase